MSLKVITPGGSGLGTAPAENTAVSELNAISAEHYWELSEVSGTTFADSGTSGNWPLNYPTSGGFRDPCMRGVVGKIRGEPKVRALGIDARALVESNDVFSTRLTTTTGAVGAWMGWASGRDTNTTTTQANKPFIGCRYPLNSINQLLWRFGLLNNGSVYYRMWTAGGWVAQWIWDDPTTVQNMQKANPSDTVITGGKMHHYVLVQRNDGNGPQLYINGSLITASPTTSFSGTGANADAWWTAAEAAASFNQVFFQLGQNCRIQLPFVKGADITSQEVSDIYTAASPAGNCGDLHEWIQAWDPDFWKPPNNMRAAMDPVEQPRSVWWEKNIGNASTTEFVDLLWSYLSNWQSVGEAINTTDWPGIDYNVQGVETGGAITPSRGSFWSGNTLSSQPWSAKWTAANGFDTGTLGMVLQIPTNGNELFRWEHDADNYFRIRMVGSSPRQFQITLQLGAGNFWQVNWDFPAATGTTGFMVITQNGVPSAGVDVYWNGVLQDGANIAGTSGGSLDGSEWFSDLTAVGEWRIKFPPASSTFDGDWFSGQLYDLWIKGGTPLTASQIFNLYSLAVGDITTLAPP